MKGLKKYLRRERRHVPRHPICEEVEFYVWDTRRKRAHTGRARGCLTSVSTRGACLQTNSLQLGDYHLLLDDDPRGSMVLAIEGPSPSGEKTWTLQAKIISYDKFPEKRKYQFDVHLQFVNISPTDLRSLEQLIKPKTSPRGSEPKR